jgi:hypothetical protein
MQLAGLHAVDDAPAAPRMQHRAWRNDAVMTKHAKQFVRVNIPAERLTKEQFAATLKRPAKQSDAEKQPRASGDERSAADDSTAGGSSPASSVPSDGR